MARRGPYSKGIERREEILRVALEVIAERGSRQASNQEIARRVGLSQAGLMHYFDSREELYIEVLRERDRRDTAQYLQPTTDFDGTLAVIDHNTRVPGLVRLYVEYSAEASLGKHPANEFFKSRQAMAHDLYAEALLAAQRAGEFGPEVDVDATADILIAATDGLQHQWLLDSSVDMVGQLRSLWASLAALSRAQPVISAQR